MLRTINLFGIDVYMTSGSVTRILQVLMSIYTHIYIYNPFMLKGDIVIHKCPCFSLLYSRYFTFILLFHIPYALIYIQANLTLTYHHLTVTLFGAKIIPWCLSTLDYIYYHTIHKMKYIQ